MKKVAIVHDWLTGMRGGEKVLEVLCELYPDAHLYTLLHIKGSVSGTIEGMDIRTSFIQRLPFIKERYRQYLPLFPSAIEQLDLQGYDLVLSSSHCVAKGVVPSPHACHISYVHTPMRYVWDMYYGYLERGRVGRLARMVSPFIANYLRMWDVTSSNRVDYFIANSMYVGRRIEKYYSRSFDVIYPPVDIEKFDLSDKDEEHYLVVSSFAPYKRIDLAIEVFNRLKLPLKIIGTGAEEKRLKAIAGATIEFLGWRSDEELKECLGACKALLFPGKEDFGIVPLEAMACGKPVIAYGKGGVLETVVPLGQAEGKRRGPAPTGVFFAEQTVGSMVAAIELFEKNRARFDKGAIKEHILRFDRSCFKERIAGFIDGKYEEFVDAKETE